MYRHQIWGRDFLRAWSQNVGSRSSKSFSRTIQRDGSPAKMPWRTSISRSTRWPSTRQCFQRGRQSQRCLDDMLRRLDRPNHRPVSLPNVTQILGLNTTPTWLQFVYRTKYNLVGLNKYWCRGVFFLNDQRIEVSLVCSNPATITKMKISSKEDWVEA